MMVQIFFFCNTATSRINKHNAVDKYIFDVFFVIACFVYNDAYYVVLQLINNNKTTFFIINDFSESLTINTILSAGFDIIHFATIF